MADSKKYDGSQWEHSLRKLTTATADIEPTIYTDGTAITSYTIKGNTTQSGTPTPSNPVAVTGVGNKTANLIEGVISNSVINTSGVIEASQNYSTMYAPVTSGETYTFAYSASGVDVNYIYGLFATLPKSGSVTYDNSRVVVPYSTSSTITLTIPSGVSYIGMRIPNAALTSGKGIMINQGSEIATYEPWGYKIPISSGGVTTNIYLSEPLYKIADTADTINTDGTVTRRIGKIDLGSLSWSIGSSGNITTTENVPNLHIINNAGKDNAFCTILSETYPNYVASTNYSFSSCLNSQPRPFINKTGFEGLTADQFKEAVKGEYMYYILATPTTEQITLPSIPTTEGANSITVDTTVQPSEFTATWTGWHDASVKEKSENLFDEAQISSITTPIGDRYGSIFESGVGTYTIDVTGITNSGDYLYADKVLSDGTGGARYYIVNNGTKTTTQLTISNEGEKFLIYNASGDNLAASQAKFDRWLIMLNTGSTALPYAPYWE